MKHITYKDGKVGLYLTPVQWAKISRSCHFAGETVYTKEAEEWRAYALLLESCAESGFARWHMQPEDEEALDESLRLNGLE